MEMNSPVQSKTEEMVIGKNIYTVTTTFSDTARETVEQKYLRYVSDRVSAAIKDEQSA